MERADEEGEREGRRRREGGGREKWEMRMAEVIGRESGRRQG